MARQFGGLETSGRQRLGKYEILARLGSGGMAAVYKAKDADTGRIVALKVLPPEVAKPSWIRRFSREALTSARMNHPNIIDVFELNEANGVHYIAMEYVDGLNLDSYVSAKGKLDAAEALDIVVQTARALDHAHHHGVVHRDVKPSNLLLTQLDGRRLVKLTDLGLARDTKTEEQTRLTRHGSTLGTVDYISPEQAHGGHLADGRSDLYSLGCTMYHLLTGGPPFPGGSITEKLYRQVNLPPADPREANPAISDSVLHILGKLLHKKPEDRYQTPTELIIDLERELERLARPSTETIAGLADGTLLNIPLPRPSNDEPSALPDNAPRWSPSLPSRQRAKAASSSDAAQPPGLFDYLWQEVTEHWVFLGCLAIVIATGVLLFLFLQD